MKNEAIIDAVVDMNPNEILVVLEHATYVTDERTTDIWVCPNEPILSDILTLAKGRATWIEQVREAGYEVGDED